MTQGGQLVPRLTIRPSLLTLALLAPLTAGDGVGIAPQRLMTD